jgi:hypothetical protein
VDSLPELEINLFENFSWAILGPIPMAIGVLIILAIILSMVIPKKSILNNFVGWMLAIATIMCFVIFIPKV